MHKLNVLFTLTSLSVLLVTIERFSFTTKVLLQPYNFLRLHELLQMTILILLTVIIPFFILYIISNSFQLFSKKHLWWLPLLFIVGIYFYATGNGFHEMASYTLNQYCHIKALYGILCYGLFFDDYYTGNSFYFIGGLFMVLSLVLTEKINPNTTFKKDDFIILIINAVIYSFAIFAYAAFDPVFIGLIYTLIVVVIVDVLWFFVRNKTLQHPVIFYNALSYTLAAIAAWIIRFH